MITSNSVQFGDDGTLGTQRFQEIRSAAYEHLLSRIEELGAEFGRWSRSAIQEFVNIEVAGFVRMRRVPVNESELHQIADALTKELAGLGPLEDLLADPAVEDILINGYENVFVSRQGILTREAAGFTDTSTPRSEERRVGKVSVSTCRSRGSLYH